MKNFRVAVNLLCESKFACRRIGINCDIQDNHVQENNWKEPLRGLPAGKPAGKTQVHEHGRRVPSAIRPETSQHPVG